MLRGIRILTFGNIRFGFVRPFAFAISTHLYPSEYARTAIVQRLSPLAMVYSPLFIGVRLVGFCFRDVVGFLG